MRIVFKVHVMHFLDDWQLTPESVAIHVPTQTLVVADLHLGYAQARQQRGEAIPVQRVTRQLQRIADVAQRSQATRLVIAGDVFENAPTSELYDECAAWLRAAQLELVGIAPGNHDRALGRICRAWPICLEGVLLGSWHVVHGHERLPPGNVVCGHEHPCMRLGPQVAAPCYLVRADRLVLPAFTRDAAGVDVLHDRRWASYRCIVTTGEKVLDFGELQALQRLS